MEELRRRGYLVGPSNGAGLLLVTLPPDGSNAWDVQRELEASFPDTRLGLNYVYRTYKPYRGASQPEMLPKGTARKGCSAELCYGPDVIHWDKSLAVCAAGLKVGMIDTSIDEAHPAFPPKGVKVFDLARKQDAPPAVHWHGTGVLSLMAGVADSSTPGLIPGAAFSAANVFFTNKDGELETDTAHLTEALAAMKGEGVRVVNMSLVGPQDDLVHERIIDMATNDGVVFVAAAGNGGPDALPGYPAAYEEVIAVTAVDRNKASYDHANRGTYIDMAAPGVQILAALPGGKEGLLSGTSFAAPFVTAVVAVAYRDTGLEKAAKEGRGRLDPERRDAVAPVPQGRAADPQSDQRIRLGSSAGEMRERRRERLLGVRRQADAVGADGGHGAGAASGGVDRAGQLARADDRSTGVPAVRGCEVVHWGWLWPSRGPPMRCGRALKRRPASAAVRQRGAGAGAVKRAGRAVRDWHGKGVYRLGPPSIEATPLWCGCVSCEARSNSIAWVGGAASRGRALRASRPLRTAGLVSGPVNALLYDAHCTMGGCDHLG